MNQDWGLNGRSSTWDTKRAVWNAVRPWGVKVIKMAKAANNTTNAKTVRRAHLLTLMAQSQFQGASRRVQRPTTLITESPSNQRWCVMPNLKNRSPQPAISSNRPFGKLNNCLELSRYMEGAEASKRFATARYGVPDTSAWSMAWWLVIGADGAGSGHSGS